VAQQFKEDQNAFVDPKEGASKKAILAAKSNNIAAMEDALEEAIPINTADQFGNTLLILAAQQGSKRMCKFLLRRGANINLQALSGNTFLHYCYAYGQDELGEYLKGKGADDSILNIDEMTCYEGLSAEALAEDDDEGDEEVDLGGLIAVNNM
jgi:ankyrin repeat protein